MAYVMSVAVVVVVDKSVAVAVAVAMSPVSVVVVVTGSMARYSRQKSSACCVRDGKHSSKMVWRQVKNSSTPLTLHCSGAKVQNGDFAITGAPSNRSCRID